MVAPNCAMPTLGRVAIVPELDNGDAGLFVGSKAGAFDERCLDSGGQFDAPSWRVSLNELGQIAFEDSGIFLSNPNGTFTTITEPPGDGDTRRVTGREAGWSSVSLPVSRWHCQTWRISRATFPTATEPLSALRGAPVTYARPPTTAAGFRRICHAS
jgi:hypothetical protein